MRVKPSKIIYEMNIKNQIRVAYKDRTDSTGAYTSLKTDPTGAVTTISRSSKEGLGSNLQKSFMRNE